MELYSVSGCQDVGNITVQCVRPVTLTLRGIGFSSVGPWYYASVLIALTSNVTLNAEYDADFYNSRLQIQRSALNDTYAQVFLTNDVGYNGFEPDVLLNVTFSGGGPGRPYATLAAISFAALPKPELTGITGCAGGDNPALNLTYGCLPTRDMLTLQGSSFSSLNQTEVRLWLGDSSSILRLGDTSDTETLGDTYFVFTLKTLYAELVAITQYNGGPVPLYLSHTFRQRSTSWRTDSNVYLQFDPVPPPEVKGWDANGRCNNDDGLPTDCWEGNAAIFLKGDYLYATSVTIGSVPAVTYSTSRPGTQLTLALPYGQFAPGVRYTLNITNPFNSTVLTDWISFRPSVSISSFEPCVDTGTQSLLKCSFGSVLVFHPFNWNLTALQRIEITAEKTPGTRLCTNVQQLDPVTMSCVLPQRWNAWSWDLTQTFTAVLYNGSASASVSDLRIFDLLNSPRITSVTGCASTSPSGLQLNECLGGELLTLTGVNFDSSAWTVFVQQDENYECDVLQVVGNSTLLCQLPVPDNSGPALNVQYELVVRGVVPLQELISNALYVTFVSEITPQSSSSSTPLPAPQTSSSSSSGSTAGSSAGVGFSSSSSSASSGVSSSNSSAVTSGGSGSNGLPAVAIAGLVIGLVVFVCAVALCANALQLRQRVDKLARRLQLSSRRSLEMPEHSRIAMMAEPHAQSDHARAPQS